MSFEEQPGEARELPFLHALHACRGDLARESRLISELVRNVRLDVRTHDGMKAHDGSCDAIADVDEIASTVGNLSSTGRPAAYDSEPLFESFARSVAHSGDLWVSLSEEIRVLSHLVGRIVSNTGGYTTCQVERDEDEDAVDIAMRMIAVKAYAFHDLSQRQKDERAAREHARRAAERKEAKHEA